MIELQSHEPDGTIERHFIPLRPVSMSSSLVLRVQSGPTDVPKFPFNRIQHVIARHTAAALNPKPGDGIFFPQWSTPVALQELALLVYQRAGPAHFGPSRGAGQFAFVAGAMLDTSVKTGASTPNFVGLEGPTGPPTNIVVVFITPEFEIHTMYPTGPIMHFYGDDWS